MALAPSTVRSTALAVLSSVIVGAAFAVACAPHTATTPIPTTGAVREELHGRLDGVDRTARIALAGGIARAAVTSTTKWRIDEQGGRHLLVKGSGGEGWRIEQRGALLRVSGDGDDATPWRQGPFVARPTTSDGFVQYNGKRYRGELWFTPTDSGILVVNRVAVEDYLRGVVGLELGTRNATDRSALEAQAVAARSYSYIRVPANGAEEPARGWHMVATVTNQVYGGVEAEHPLVNQAIDATTGLVLRYGGLIVDAPYFSACGGRTASPRDAWRDAREEPYLQPVDDVDPATGRPFCDISPRNHWTEELSEQQVSDAVRRALEVQGAQRPQTTTVRDIEVADRTASGRVGALVFRTDRGDIRIGARDVRNVLRDARGAILSSTYFSVDRAAHSGSR